eukprot:m.45963 g.45963  ORF g.45963 m.45963 type:complete len:255 (-) comp14716_c0_seq2:49-813(-)
MSKKGQLLTTPAAMKRETSQIAANQEVLRQTQRTSLLREATELTEKSVQRALTKSPRDPSVTSRALAAAALTPTEMTEHVEERLRLLDVVRATGPEAMFELLVGLLSGSDGDLRVRVEVQRALSKVFPRPADASAGLVPGLSHCKRCHQSYDPRYNVDGDCQIAHAENTASPHELIKKNTKESIWRTACCHKDITADPDIPRLVPGPEHGLCFSGRHAASDKDIDWFNCVTIVRCSTSGPGGRCDREPPKSSYT